MHLLVCMKMFDANIITRTLVVTAQLTMTPFLMVVYMIKPGALHRFVGYLEETAVHTYGNIVQHVETPGTHLHTSWAALPAPDIAKNYWALSPDATWHECLRHMLADEAHHRSVLRGLMLPFHILDGVSEGGLRAVHFDTIPIKL
jgi:hypothetical protein